MKGLAGALGVKPNRISPEVWSRLQNAIENAQTFWWGFIEKQTIMAGLLFDCIALELKVFTPLHINQRGGFSLMALEACLYWRSSLRCQTSKSLVVSCFTSTFHFNALTLSFWHPNWETHAYFLVDLPFLWCFCQTLNRFYNSLLT